MVIRATSLLACALFLGSGCTTNETVGSTRVDAAEGHALLDDYLAHVEQMAKSGSINAFPEALAEHEQRAKKLDDAGKLDPAFRARHRRLVDVIRLVVTPPVDDRARRDTDAQLDAFAREVGGPGAPPIETSGGLAAIAPLLVEEVLSLHMLLDGETDREKARAKYLASLEK